MPVVKLDHEVFVILVSEARKLGISVKDLITMIVAEYFKEEPEEEIEEEPEPEEEEEEAEAEAEEEEEEAD